MNIQVNWQGMPAWRPSKRAGDCAAGETAGRHRYGQWYCHSGQPIVTVKQSFGVRICLPFFEMGENLMNMGSELK